MKTLLSKLPNEKAQKELKQFLIAGYVCAIISFFIFGWLAIVAAAFATRSFVLSFHEGNKTNSKIKILKITSILLLVVSLLELLALILG